MQGTGIAMGKYERKRGCSNGGFVRRGVQKGHMYVKGKTRKASRERTADARVITRLDSTGVKRLCKARRGGQLLVGIAADRPPEAASPDALPRNADHFLLACRERAVARTLPCDGVRLADVVQGVQTEHNGVCHWPHTGDARGRLVGRTERRARQWWRDGENALMRVEGTG